MHLRIMVKVFHRVNGERDLRHQLVEDNLKKLILMFTMSIMMLLNNKSVLFSKRMLLVKTKRKLVDFQEVHTMHHS